MKRIQLLALFIACSTLFAFLPVNQTRSSVINPGIFTSEVVSFNPSPIDPATNYESLGGSIVQNIYEQLFSYANNSLTENIPSLALNYSVSPNGSLYTFTLRSGVRFALQPGESIGQPFNAYVMQYSIDRAIIMNVHGPSWMLEDWINGAKSFEQNNNLNISQSQKFLALKSVWATSPTQLTINLTSPFEGFLSVLEFPVASAISPKAIIDNEPVTYTTNQSNSVYGMISLNDMFPGVSNLTILSNLGLPTNYNTANSGIVPESYVGNYNQYTWLNTHSAGTGPYMVHSLTVGVGATLVKNLNWWNSASFATNGINSIQITQVGSITTRENDLKKGTADIADIGINYLSDLMNVTSLQVQYPGISFYDYNTLDNAVFAMNENPTLSSGQIAENLASNYSFGTDNVSRLLKYSWNTTNGTLQYASPGNPFTSLLFRKAFAYSFPTNEYILQALDGFGFRMEGIIPKGLLGYDSNLIANGNIPTFNVTVAKALFNQVGFQGTIVLTYDASSATETVAASLLQNSINNLGVGITISLDAVSSGSYDSTVLSGSTALFLMGWAPDFADAHDYTVPFYRSDGLFPIAIHYSNPQVDNLVNSGAATSNLTTRASIYNQLEVNATGDYPYIYLAQSQTVILVRSWIQGINNPQTDSENPMLSTFNYQFLSKVDLSPPPSTSSSSMTSSMTSTSSISTSSTFSSGTTNIKSSINLSTTPGFELFTFIIGIFIIVIPIRKRKNSMKK